MPSIFKFHCDDCNKDFELLIHPSTMVPYCKQCKSENVEKQITSFRIGDYRPWKMAGQRLK